MNIIPTAQRRKHWEEYRFCAWWIVCVTKWFCLTRCKLYKCNTMFSGFTLKRGGGKNPQGQSKTDSLRSTQQFKSQEVKYVKWEAKLTLLSACKKAEQPLLCCLNLQPLWNVPQQTFLPEAPASIYSHFFCCPIYFQERLQLPASFKALKFLFSKPQVITDKSSIHLPCWLQLIALFASHCFQRGGARRVTHPAGTHLGFRDVMLNSLFG